MNRLWGLLLAGTVFGCGGGQTGAPPISACASPPSRWPAERLSRTSEGGALEVEAWLWNAVDGDAAGPLVFKVALTTHTGDANAFDLPALAEVQGGEGARLSEGLSWEAISGDSHHRLGWLRAGHQLPGGGHLVGCQTAELRLVLREVGIPERVFSWGEPYLGALRRD